MDAEDTAGYREPCGQCAAVDWGVSQEGRFYCRSCHNVIERSREVADPSLDRGANRVRRLDKGPRTKRAEGGHMWMVCEAFQFILTNQADALLRLGVDSLFKDLVLCQLWRLYLQRSRQAFTERPVRLSRRSSGLADSDSDSDGGESSARSVSGTDGEADPPSVAGSRTGSGCDWSGSADAASYLHAQRNRRSRLLTMRKTVALLHVALVWSREALTLSDLLRLARDGHVPYVNAYEELPEQMKVTGKDAALFAVESVPSYQLVHQDAQDLVRFLRLPAFPPVSRETPLHPAPLCMRYLTDANLPDELHPWVCALMERAGMADERLHTPEPGRRRVLPSYDLQAAALILVTMKVLFGLDDRTEWDLANDVRESAGDTFSLRRWYRLMQAALLQGQQTRERSVARKQWRPKKPIISRKADRHHVVKKRRVAEQLRGCFQTLSSSPAGARDEGPCSFTFRWGDESGSDGPSMHHQKLGSVLTLQDHVLTPSNCLYWHPALQRCKNGWCSGAHFLSEVESSLPSSFAWLLQLFSFMLHVEPAAVLEEVLNVERRLFGCKTPSGRTGTARNQSRKRPLVQDRVYVGLAQKKARPGSEPAPV